jgi:ubiquinol-cytochrome c reductase iron-sulfur subunit
MATKKVTKTKAKAPKSKATTAKHDDACSPECGSRRDFMVLTASATAAVGAACAAVPLIGSMTPADDVLALSSTEVKIDGVQPGDIKRVMWRGQPVFIKRRTPEEIAAAKKDDNVAMPDPQTDSARVKPGKEEWLIVVAACTHLGCIPTAGTGDYGAWLCPCHGSHYDFSERIRKGPAPRNLGVPPYEFINDTTIKIG